MCGVTCSMMPMVVSWVIALPASSETIRGIFWPTRMLASRLSVVVMTGLQIRCALLVLSSASTFTISSPQSCTVATLQGARRVLHRVVERQVAADVVAGAHEVGRPTS